MTGVVEELPASSPTSPLKGRRETASDRGYRVVVLTDCCESIDDEMHQFSITRILPIVGEIATAADFTETAETL